jgi:MoaE-MoaD fusion protein
MRVQVRLFAMLRERAGRDSLELELADGSTAGDALVATGERAGLADLLERMPIAVAVNREYVRGDAALADGDEVALIPPVSGGAEGDDGGGPALGAVDLHARVVDAVLSIERLAAAVGRPAAGAIVTFAGTTREVPRLEYEAYAEMAEERMRSILSEAIERHGLEAAAAEHRVGEVPLGESSVVVAVSAAHRAEAFAGAREVIDRIKAEAPIWKREVTGEDRGGKRAWVEGTAPSPAEGSPDEGSGSGPS